MRVQHRYLAFAVTRAALIVVGYLTLTLYPAHPVESWMGLSFPDHKWIDGFVRWDSFWYQAIVDPHPRFLPIGYSHANFFPLYALVSWLVALPFRVFLDLEHAFFAGGLIVSSVSFLLGLKAVERIAIRLAGEAAANRTMWLIALFPFSFFFTAVYADALYFCLCAWSLAHALEGRWYAGCAVAVLASLTRIPGIALFPALVLEYLRQHGWRVGPPRKALICAAILALAPIAIASYYELRYGHPLEFVRARQAGWNRASGILGYSRDFRHFFARPMLPCSGVGECLKEFAPTRVLLGVTYLALLPISAALALIHRRQLGVALTVWVLASILVSLPNGFDGVGRFTAVLFPIFISAAILLRNRIAFTLVCAAWVPFLLLFFAQFARWRQVL